MTQKYKIDNEESDDDKLLSGRHDLGLSGSGTPKEIPIAAYILVVKHNTIDRRI